MKNMYLMIDNIETLKWTAHSLREKGLPEQAALFEERARYLEEKYDLVVPDKAYALKLNDVKV